MLFIRKSNDIEQVFELDEKLHFNA